MILSTTDHRALETLRQAAYTVASRQDPRLSMVMRSPAGPLDWEVSWLDITQAFDQASWDCFVEERVQEGVRIHRINEVEVRPRYWFP